MGRFEGMWKTAAIVGQKCGGGTVMNQSWTKVFLGPVDEEVRIVYLILLVYVCVNLESGAMTF